MTVGQKPGLILNARKSESRDAPSTISGVGSGMAAGRRAKYQGEQSALAEEGKAKQEEFAGQAEKEASSLSSLIQAYRESLMG